MASVRGAAKARPDSRKHARLPVAASPGFQTLRTRTWILVCFYAIILASLPFWYKTTTIERLALPQQDVQDWEARLPCPIRFRHTLTLKLPAENAATVNEKEVARDLARALNAASDGVWVNEAEEGQEEITAAEGASSEETAADPASSTSSDPAKSKRPTPLEHAACIDWDVRLSDSVTFEPSSMHYVITLANDDGIDSFLSTSTTRRFHLDLHHSLDGKTSSEVAWTLASQLSRILQLPYRDLFFHATVPTLGEASYDDALIQNALRRIDRIETDKRTIPYTQNVRLVFSLINEDSTAAKASENDRSAISGVAGWHADEARKALLKRIGPLVEAMQGTHKIVTELQTIWFAPLSFEPRVLQIARTPEVTTQAAVQSSEGRGEGEGQETSDIDDVDPSQDENTTLSVTEPVVEYDNFHLIRHDDLQIFVDAGEWGLSAGGTSFRTENVQSSDLGDELRSLVEQNERTLHFIIYVPKPAHRPLRIAADTEASSMSNATSWLVPQWGGVSIYNLGFEQGESKTGSGRERKEHGMLSSLTSDELDKAFVSFNRQLSTLLGLRAGGKAGVAGAELPSTEARLAISLDALARRRIIGSVRESVRTLGSIVRLVEKIKVLGVGEKVRNDVRQALLMLERARQDSKHGEILIRQGASSQSPVPLSPLLHLLQLGYAAELLSSRAFFNPKMLGQLYFPDEHKYAVYTPLFGPLAMPLLVAGMRLLKERRKKAKEATEAAAKKDA